MNSIETLHETIIEIATAIEPDTVIENGGVKEFPQLMRTFSEAGKELLDTEYGKVKPRIDVKKVHNAFSEMAGIVRKHPDDFECLKPSLEQAMFLTHKTKKKPFIQRLRNYFNYGMALES